MACGVCVTRSFEETLQSTVQTAADNTITPASSRPLLEILVLGHRIHSTHYLLSLTRSRVHCHTYTEIRDEELITVPWPLATMHGAGRASFSIVASAFDDTLLDAPRVLLVPVVCASVL